MNYDLFAMIIAFMALTLIMNRHTVTLTRQVEQLRKETEQRFENSRNEMNQFRTEMNRRFDEANTERNRRFDTSATTWQTFESAWRGWKRTSEPAKLALRTRHDADRTDDR